MASPCRVCSGWLLVVYWVQEHLFLIQRGRILMPVRSRSADDPPRHTSSFVCEVPLRVSRAQERIRLARLEAARQVYNACLGEAHTRVRLVRQSKAFQRARTLPRDDPTRKTRFTQARAQHAFSAYALHAYVQAIGACLARGPSRQPDPPETCQPSVSRRESAAPGHSATCSLQGAAPTGHSRRQDQQQWHPVVPGPRGMERPGVAGPPGFPRSGPGPWPRLSGEVCPLGPAQTGGAQPLLCPVGVLRETLPQTTAPAGNRRGWARPG